MKIIEQFKKIVIEIKKLFVKPVHYIGGSDNLPPPLTKEEEMKLLEAYNGQPEIKRTLIERNLRLVVYIARKFDNTAVGIEDLVSIGTIGLIKSINTYKPDKNTKLATYASRCIENEILMFLRKSSPQKMEVSLDEPLNTDWDGNELLLSDILGTDPDVVMQPIEDCVDMEILKDCLKNLSKRELNIIHLRFGLDGREGMTQKDVADKLGISQSYISRLEKRIITQLKKDMLKVM